MITIENFAMDCAASGLVLFFLIIQRVTYRQCRGLGTGWNITEHQWLRVRTKQT